MSALPPLKRAKREPVAPTSSSSKQEDDPIEFKLNGVTYGAVCCQDCKAVKPVYGMTRHPRFSMVCKACIESWQANQPCPAPLDWTGFTYVFDDTEDGVRTFKVPSAEITPRLLQVMADWSKISQEDMKLYCDTIHRWGKAGYDVDERSSLIKGAHVLYWKSYN